MPQESSGSDANEDLRELLTRVRLGGDLHDAARQRWQTAIDSGDLEAMERARRTFLYTGAARLEELAKAGLAFLLVALRGGGR